MYALIVFIQQLFSVAKSRRLPLSFLVLLIELLFNPMGLFVRTLVVLHTISVIPFELWCYIGGRVGM
jgi:hypothetical protein